MNDERRASDDESATLRIVYVYLIEARLVNASKSKPIKAWSVINQGIIYDLILDQSQLVKA